MSNSKKAVLLIGFGGPTEPAGVRPFLESVAQGVRIPKERLDEVAHHYEAVGGFSPFNRLAFAQRAALEKYLGQKGISCPVALGLRHSKPSFVDAFKVFKRYSIDKVCAIVLSVFRSYSSFEKYQERIEEAKRHAGAESIGLTYLPSFSEHPLFIQAQSDRIKTVLNTLTAEHRSKVYFLFSAHSIPLEMSQKSGYDKQYEKTASLIANEARLSQWGICYQSRSGSPRDPWLEPAVGEKIKTLDRKRFNSVMLIPVGFLCDNVEVLYDLDIEAKKEAEELGFKYLRAATVMDHPLFIELLGQMVCESR